MCPIVSFSNEKSTTDQKKSPLHFIPSSDFIIENNCNRGHYLILHIEWHGFWCEWHYKRRIVVYLILAIKITQMISDGNYLFAYGDQNTFLLTINNL